MNTNTGLKQPEVQSTPYDRPIPGSTGDCQSLGVSLLIATRNRPEMLRATVDSILAGDEVPNEIIIIDQSDKTQSEQTQTEFNKLKVHRECKVRYEWSQVVGVARARNRGMALAQHDYLVLIDDDMFVDAAWLGKLIRELVQAGPKSVVSGRVLPALEEGDSSYVPSAISDETPVAYQGRVGKDVLYSGNMALRRQLFDEIGGFDERLGPGTSFPAAEDNDLGYRILEAGYTIHYAPKAIVYHRAWRSEAEFLRLRWAYGVGRGAFYAKHSTLRDRYILKRMVQDVGSHLWRAGRNYRHSRQSARSDALLGLGIMNGAVRWWFTKQGTDF